MNKLRVSAAFIMILLTVMLVLMTCAGTGSDNSSILQSGDESSYIDETDTGANSLDDSTADSEIPSNSTDSSSEDNISSGNSSDDNSSPEISNPGDTVIYSPKDSSKKYIAITLDDGPNGQITTKILDKFAEIGGKCTFFVVGSRINPTQGQIISRASAEGHEIANHSLTHQKYFDRVDSITMLEELSKTNALIEKYTGKAPMLMRPPGGGISNANLKICGFSTIIWSIDSVDWKLSGRGSEKQISDNINLIVSNVVNKARNGDIVLMHDLYQNTYEALCIILDILSEQGFEFVTVSELLELQATDVNIKYFSTSLKINAD